MATPTFLKSRESEAPWTARLAPSTCFPSPSTEILSAPGKYLRPGWDEKGQGLQPASSRRDRSPPSTVLRTELGSFRLPSPTGALQSDMVAALIGLAGDGW